MGSRVMYYCVIFIKEHHGFGTLSGSAREDTRLGQWTMGCS